MKQIDEKVRFFKALGDPIRLEIVYHLLGLQSPICICDLSKVIKRDPSVIFRHVKLLNQAGIIHSQKENKFLMCEIKDKEHIKNILQMTR